MQWRDLQTEFSSALRNHELNVPETIRRTNGNPSVKRFNVYRNNTKVSLTDAICDSFPVVMQLVGEEFFRAMARVYVENNLPQTPLLIYYGGDFPDFIDGFEPAKGLPFLSDVARVEWAWTMAYHAADKDPVGPDALQAFPAERLGDAKFVLHPSTHLLQSEFPVMSIWSAHNQDNTSELMSQISQEGEQAVIVRPDMSVNVTLLSASAYAFFKAVSDGKTLNEAVELIDDPDELGGYLQLLFNCGCVTGMN